MNISYYWAFPLSLGFILILYVVLYGVFKKINFKRRFFGRKNSPEAISPREVSTFVSIFINPLKEKILNITPRSIKNRIGELVLLSGSKWKTGDFLILKFTLLIFIFLIFLILPVRVSGMGIKAFIGLILGVIAFILPDIYLVRKIKSRKKQIEKSLSSFVDYLLITVESGLGLDMAISKVLSKIRGPLAEELAKTMTEVKYGKSKKDAFKKLSARVNIPEFTTFLTALVNGEQLGMSVGNILRIQGEQIRDKRRQKIQEKAYKITVKLLFPLIIFIFPGIFIVILGPAIIQAMETLL